MRASFPERFGGEDNRVALRQARVHHLNHKIIRGTLVCPDDQGTAPLRGVMEALAQFIHRHLLVPVVQSRDRGGDNAHQLGVFTRLKRERGGRQGNRKARQQNEPGTERKKDQDQKEHVDQRNGADQRGVESEIALEFHLGTEGMRQSVDGRVQFNGFGQSKKRGMEQIPGVSLGGGGGREP